MMPGERKAVFFDHYLFTMAQVATIRAELAELTDILGVIPPWSTDKTTAADVFCRKIVNFGTIWYTFILDAGGTRSLLILTGTCEGVDDNKADVKRVRQACAERRVEELRQQGVLCI
jgi:hypothetical protein